MKARYLIYLLIVAAVAASGVFVIPRLLESSDPAVDIIDHSDEEDDLAARMSDEPIPTDEGERQTQFVAALEAARKAMEKGEFLVAEQHAHRAFQLSPDHPEAQLLAQRLAPRMLISAELDGRDYVGAIIKINGVIQSERTPRLFPAERGVAYLIEVAMPRATERYFTEHRQVVEINRPGPFNIRAELFEIPFYSSWPFDASDARRRQEETARLLNIPIEKSIDLGGGVMMEMILIPAGQYMRGSPASEAGRVPNEGPQRPVRITRPFYIGRYPVTQGQWQQVMGRNPSRFFGRTNPVELVSWFGAEEFVEQLGGDVRLPTEAEWEYACRAGTATHFYTGDAEADLSRAGWHAGNSAFRSWPVGQKAPNAWGLNDLHGNVWEWCQDWYAEDYYANSPLEDPQGPETGTHRIARGGAWYFPATYCRSAFRYWLLPQSSSGDVGFRLAMSIEK